MVRYLARTAKRASAPAALCMCLALQPPAPAHAQAGRFHVYSCRTPSGEAAPVDGWTVSSTGADTHELNSCGQPHGALLAALGEAPRTAETDKATWSFAPMPGEKVAAATFWRGGDADGGAEAGAGFEFWFAGPENVISKPADNFGQCAGGSLCPTGVGVPAQPMADANRLGVPVPNLGGGLFMNASCVGSAGYPCPQGKGDSNGYAAAVYLYAADITLEQAGTPTAQNVGGEVAGEGTLTGTRDLTFDATDPGAGVYEAVFTVDGQVVQRTVVDEDGGRCKDVGEASDGTPAFLYLQPCPSTVGADVAFDSTRVANGVHHLVVSVLDAAGNSAPVLDRLVTFYNPPAPGTPGPANGTNASAHATLSARWRRGAGPTLTVAYGHGARIVGRVSAPGGLGIAGAQVELRASSRPALTTSVRSGRDGSFEIALPRSISSCRVLISYRAHLGDAVPAASRVLTLRVRAGIALAISPRTAGAGSTIAFTGHLRGRPVPAEGKQLVLEARSPGGTWIQFKVVRTDRRGRYRAGYRFRFPGPAVYQFRVVSEPESDYPFAAGSSRVLSVRER
jgi:hypothetical protein